ncbi:tyrosine-type recombinase/integrase, partial [Candidatus Pacearchaeota archaeon]|nr:tyrosine-type recombinase/integrase [Candidatus Pacearchaeota archaeon]
MVTYQTQEQYQPETAYIVPYSDTVWTDFFSLEAAVKAVSDHVAKLKSTKRTPEKHTQRAYAAGLKDFIDWLDYRMPTAAIMDEYIAHLSTKRLRSGKIGLAASSIACKYIPPVRIFLDKLYRQHVPLTNGSDFIFVDQVRRNLLDASSVKPPESDEKSDISPLYRYGERLNKNEIEQILNSFDLNNLHGIRNYTIMLVGFRTGMRIAEIRRMTLADIKKEGEHWGIRVRGKGNKFDPVPASDQVIKTIRYWVAAFNADLTDDDPRY